MMALRRGMIEVRFENKRNIKVHLDVTKKNK